MEGYQPPIFDIEELAGLVGSDSFQFIDNLDSLVPQVSLDFLPVDWDEGISLDSSFSGGNADQNQNTADEDLTEKEDDLNLAVSQDNPNVEDSSSIMFEDSEFKDKSAVKMEEGGLRFPWEDDNEIPVVKVVDEDRNQCLVTQLCELCGKLLCNKSKLKQHQDNLHLGLKPFSCDLCGKKYFSRDLMINHKRGHTGEKPFSCGICDKRYRAKRYLNKHINWHISLYLEYRNKIKLELGSM